MSGDAPPRPEAGADTLVARLRARRDQGAADPVVETLSRGGFGNPDVLLLDVDGERCVLKDFGRRPRLVRSTWGRLSIRRECRAYRRLHGHPHVPQLLGRVGAHALLLEYRPGRILTRSLAAELPGGFVSKLERAIDGLHRRGVVHLDLRHRSNILAGADGEPVLLDFGSALCLDPAAQPGRGLLWLLGRVDRAAVEKWRVRLEPAGSA